MPRSVLSNSDLTEYVFHLNGRFIVVPAEDLRSAVMDCETRNAGRIVGPFDINPDTGQINDRPARMSIVDL